MPRRKSTTTRVAASQADITPKLRKALSRRSKAELVEFLLELAGENGAVLRQLTARFPVAASMPELEAATRLAIADATAFDEREINRNFDYDYDAYSEVKRNLSRLIEAQQLPLAMQLSLELMRQGSHQVEMSDEGLMTQDIEDCLSVVFKALKDCELPPNNVVKWCSEMRANDLVGFVAEKQLESLLRQFESAGGR
jgi:uncharacterized Zn finger protein